MAAINPYLNFPGNTEAAFNFYKSVFGGEFVMLQRFGETPGGDKLPPAEQKMIMHVALPIGNSVLMGTDAVESMGQKLTAGNNLHVAIQADSKDEATRIFNGLSAGGNVTMPLDDTFWGAYFGMFIDKFGLSWMINFDYKQGNA